nr:hypothetical protein Iba_chr03aCG0320 [Ipomoea batatas]
MLWASFREDIPDLTLSFYHDLDNDPGKSSCPHHSAFPPWSTPQTCHAPIFYHLLIPITFFHQKNTSVGHVHCHETCHHAYKMLQQWAQHKVHSPSSPQIPSANYHRYHHPHPHSILCPLQSVLPQSLQNFPQLLLPLLDAHQHLLLHQLAHVPRRTPLLPHPHTPPRTLRRTPTPPLPLRHIPQPRLAPPTLHRNQSSEAASLSSPAFPFLLRSPPHHRSPLSSASSATTSPPPDRSRSPPPLLPLQPSPHS